MNIIAILLISSAGISGLLMPASPKGVMTYYSSSLGNEAIFYNPSLLIAEKEGYNLNIYYTSIYLSMKSFNLGLAKKFNSFDLGISIMNYDYGAIESRPDYPTEDSVGFYTGSDFSLGLCVAKDIVANGRIGVKGKYIYENLHIYSGATIGLDFSLAYINQQSMLSVGVTNLGGTIKINNEAVNLPAKLSLGYYRTIKRFIISGDLHYLVNTGEFETSLAGEIKIEKNFETGISVNYREQFYPGFFVAIKHHGLSIKYGASLYPYNLGMINTMGISFPF